MEFYAAVRRSVYVEGLSERAAARRFGLARETVRKMLRYRLPPGYRRAKPIRCPKRDAFTGVIDHILTDDQQRPKKQRHTAKRIWERLCVEHAFTGGYTIVKDYVRRQKLGGQERFVPLAHPPGDAQADFGEALVTTVFAGADVEATERARGYFTGYPPSSPAIAILRGGKLLYMMERHQIENQEAPDIAAQLTAAFDTHCLKTAVTG